MKKIIGFGVLFLCVVLFNKETSLADSSCAKELIGTGSAMSGIRVLGYRCLTSRNCYLGKKCVDVRVFSSLSGCLIDTFINADCACLSAAEKSQADQELNQRLIECIAIRNGTVPQPTPVETTQP